MENQFCLREEFLTVELEDDLSQSKRIFIFRLLKTIALSTAIPMPRNINTIGNEGAPTMAPDGRSLVFVACANGDNEYGENRVGKGSCDLFYTKRIGSN